MTTDVLSKWELLVVSLAALASLAHGNISDEHFGCSVTKNCGQPLFLTRLLNQSKVLEAQRAAMVQFPNTSEFRRVRDVESYSGFFTVNETLGSNVFFWFFPAETKSKDSPLILWMAGGPFGSASVENAFSPTGPLQIHNSLVIPGKYRWTKSMNVLYLDSSTAVGFSFTKNSSDHANQSERLTKDLYEALSQFFLLFPDQRTKNLFIAGISHAGKYAPALAYEIHAKNTNATIEINLKGIAIGNGFVDPVLQIGYSKFLYGVGLIDSETKIQFAKIEERIKSLILDKEYISASGELCKYLYDVKGSKSIMVNVTGVSVYNYLTAEEDQEKTSQTYSASLRRMMAKPEFRKSIHAGGQEFRASNPKHANPCPADIVGSAADELEVLMDNYRVVLYTGQLDVVCNYRSMVDYIEELEWSGDEAYSNATRRQWWVDGDLAGYAKTVGNFTEILVRDAGHFAHEDQPLWIYDLFNRITHNDELF